MNRQRQRFKLGDNKEKFYEINIYQRAYFLKNYYKRLLGQGGRAVHYTSPQSFN